MQSPSKRTASDFESNRGNFISEEKKKRRISPVTSLMHILEHNVGTIIVNFLDICDLISLERVTKSLKDIIGEKIVKNPESIRDYVLRNVESIKNDYNSIKNFLEKRALEAYITGETLNFYLSSYDNIIASFADSILSNYIQIKTITLCDEKNKIFGHIRLDPTNSTLLHFHGNVSLLQQFFNNFRFEELKNKNGNFAQDEKIDYGQGLSIRGVEYVSYKLVYDIIAKLYETCKKIMGDTPLQLSWKHLSLHPTVKEIMPIEKEKIAVDLFLERVYQQLKKEVIFHLPIYFKDSLTSDYNLQMFEFNNNAKIDFHRTSGPRIIPHYLIDKYPDIVIEQSDPNVPLDIVLEHFWFKIKGHRVPLVTLFNVIESECYNCIMDSLPEKWCTAYEHEGPKCHRQTESKVCDVCSPNEKNVWGEWM